MAMRNMTVNLKIGMTELLGQIIAKNGVPADKAVAAYSRIRNFRKLDFPKIDRAGKGREDYFTIAEAQKLNMAVALNLAGVAPEKAVRMVNSISENTNISGNAPVSFELHSEMNGEPVGAVTIFASNGPPVGWPALPSKRTIPKPSGVHDVVMPPRGVPASVSSGTALLRYGEPIEAQEQQSQPTTMADDLLSGADAAATYIGITPRQVYRMSESGQLPVIRKGRRLFYRKSDLEAAFQ